MNKETHWIIVSNVKRKFFLKNFFFKSIYKSNTHIYGIPKILKMFARIKIQKYSYRSSICFLNNRCLLSGRGYSIKTKYKLSRFFLRKNYNRLLISGLKRASW